MRPSLLTRALLACLSAAALTTGPAALPAAAAPASAATSARTAASEPIYSFANAIRETVWVDTGLPNASGPGTARVAVDIVRPREAAQAGIPVPTIMDASPYYACCGRGNESQKKTYDSLGRPVGFPLFYDNYFVPRGYAIVLVDLAGTNRSRGCNDVGGAYDITSAQRVVQWLTHRATAYTTATSNTTVVASWASPSVGMIGKSWDGTIANGVAATGVEGLKTIVPIAAISSWYDYYRASGANLTSGSPRNLASVVENPAAASGCTAVHSDLTSGAPSSGDRTAMWRARDYVANAAKVKASVFLVHGVNDLNVKTINVGQWWSALPAGVERRIWLSGTGHVDPFDFRRSTWVSTLHAWFDHYLLGIDNGVQLAPQASIERAPGVWVDEQTWAANTLAPTTLRPRKGTTNGLGVLGTTAPAPGTTEVFTDNPNRSNRDWATGPTTASSSRVLFSTGVLASDVRVSGTTSITVTARSSLSAARVSAVLVDYGPATIRNYLGSGEGISNLTTRSCWGDSTSGDSACYLDTRASTTAVDRDVISRGWSDLGHYASLDSRVSLTPNQPYTITFNLATTDRVIKAGHQLALIIAGTDSGSITGTGGTPQVTIDLAGTSVRVPLVGSIAGARQAPITSEKGLIGTAPNIEARFR